MTTASARGAWEFWIDRGGTFTDVVAKRPGRRARHPQAAVRESRAVPGRGRRRHPPPARRARGRGGAGRRPRRREDGHDRRDQRAARAQGRAHGPRGHARLPRRPAHRLPEPAAAVRPPHRAARTAVLAGDRSRRADRRPRRTSSRRSTKRRRAATCRRAFDAGYRAVAIVLMHGYRYRQHEAALERIAAEIGFPQVSVSHKVSPLMKFVARGDTTVVDAYLSPILRRYVEQVAGDLPDTRLLFMQSSGGLTDARRFQGKDSILSGPAGGIVGMVRTSLAAGFDRVIGFDMGGTSTDVSHFAGRDVSDCERAFETQVAGVRMRAPMMSIHTVAAGGGSILHFDGARLRVGPDSAGANPGPACYRRGGPLAVTDCNVMVGKIQPAFFPHVFGPRGDQPLDADVVRERFAELAARIRAETGRGPLGGTGGRGLHRHRGRQHGRSDQAHLGAARARRHAVHAVGIRRRRRPARVPGRRRARHDADLRPPAGRRAVGLRHGPGGPDGDARGVGGTPSRGRGDGRARRDARAARRRRCPGPAVAGRRARPHPRRAARAPALRGHRHGADRPGRHARGNAGARSTRST